MNLEENILSTCSEKCKSIYAELRFQENYDLIRF